MPGNVRIYKSPQVLEIRLPPLFYPLAGRLRRAPGGQDQCGQVGGDRRGQLAPGGGRRL